MTFLLQLLKARLTRKSITFLGLLLALHTLTIQADTIGIICSFDNGARYEWMRAEAGARFVDINDYGQSVMTRGFLHQEPSNIATPLEIAFIDAESVDRQMIAAEYQFDLEYEYFFSMTKWSFNNDAEVVGNIHLANRNPDRENDDQIHDYEQFSTMFSYIWDPANGFRDMATEVQGLTGRYDIGNATFPAIGSTTDPDAPTFNVINYDPANAGYSEIPFPQTIAIRKHEHHITEGMLNSIEEQCGTRPYWEPENPNDSRFNSNTNFEFINGGEDIIRLAVPRLSVSGVVSWNDADGNLLPRGTTEGEVGYRLSLEYRLTNTGALDLNSLTSEIELVGEGADNILRVNRIDQPETSLTRMVRGTTQHAFLSAIGVGSAGIRMKISGVAENGTPVVVYSPTYNVSIVSDATQLTATLRFTAPDTTAHVNEEETFGVTLQLNTNDGIGDVKQIVTNTTFNEATNLSIVSSPTIPADLTMSPNTERKFNWTLKADTLGKWIINTSVDGIDGFGLAFNRRDTLEGVVHGDIGEISIVFPADGVQLPKGDDTAKLEPVTFPVRVHIAIPSDGATVNNVKLGVAGDPEPLKIGKVRFIRETGEWVPVSPPFPFPLKVVSGPVPVVVEQITKGTEAVFEFMVEASASGTFEFDVIVEGDIDNDGTAVTVRQASPADTRLTVKGEAVLGITLEISGPDTISEGGAIEIIGEVENLSDADTIQLVPVRILSEGQGVVRGPIDFDTGILPERDTVGIFNPTLLSKTDDPSGEFTKAKFRVRVETDRIPGMDWNLGRLPVLITAAIGGDIIDNVTNQPRELTDDEFAFKFGKGKFVRGNDTLLRAQVNPNPKLPRQLTTEQYALEMYGRGLENLANGGINAVMSVPQMMVGLKQAGVKLSSIIANEASLDAQAAKNQLRLMWAWADWQTEIYLKTQHTKAAEDVYDEIAAELEAYVAHNEANRAFVKSTVRNAVDNLFLSMINYSDEAWEAASYGPNDRLAEILARPAEPLGQLLTEEIAFAGIGLWLNKVSRSVRIANAVDNARVVKLANAADKVEDATLSKKSAWAKNHDFDPRLVGGGEKLKNLSAGAPVGPLQALRGWAVDRVSDLNLRQISKELGVIVALRSRADETIRWLDETFVAAGQTIKGIVLKPFPVKTKNVNYHDVNYLGYKDGVGYRNTNGTGGGDKGTVIVAEPIDQSEVLANLDLRGADPFVRKEVLKRHNKRWKEWYGRDCCVRQFNPEKLSETQKLKNIANVIDAETGIRSGEIDIPAEGQVPIPEDNFDTRGLPTRTVKRRFEMRPVADPNSTTGFNREYWEIWMEDKDGIMKRMSGDIDLVSVNKMDGAALDPLDEFTENVAIQLRDRVDAQHPWSTTLDIPGNPQVREDFLNDHRWHPTDPTKRGEPLLIYVNGEAKVGWFDPTRQISRENPLESMLWLDGSHADIEDVIGIQQDLRNALRDPSTVTTNAYQTTSTSLRTALDIADATQGTNYALVAIRTVRTGGAVYRVGGRSQIEKRDETGQWHETDPETEIINNEILIVPETAIADARQGDRVLDIVENALDFDWRDMFRVGDEITIGIDGENPETNVIVQHGSLVLRDPLQYDHPAGTLVIMSRAGDQNLDTDGDGIADYLDAFPSDPTETTDTDLDGIGNNADEDDDNDGISDVDELHYGSDPLDNQDTPDDHRPMQPLISNLFADQLNPLTHFSLEISTFSDPDETGMATAIKVIIEGPTDTGSGIVFQGEMPINELHTIELPTGILDTDTLYSLSISYIDATGLASDVSEIFQFTTDVLNPDDQNANLIEDSAETTAEYDVNNNGINDTDDGIAVIINAENYEAVGLYPEIGSISHLSVMAINEIPLTLIPDNQTEFPFGLIGFRINGLVTGDEVTVTYYLTSALQENSQWYQYDPNQGLMDISSQVVIVSDQIIEVTYIDGGIGDLDGVANGRIINTGGMAIMKSNEVIKSGGSGALSIFSLLVLFMSWIYIYMVALKTRVTS